MTPTVNIPPWLPPHRRCGMTFLDADGDVHMCQMPRVHGGEHHGDHGPTATPTRLARRATMPDPPTYLRYSPATGWWDPAVPLPYWRRPWWRAFRLTPSCLPCWRIFRDRRSYEGHYRAVHTERSER